MLLLDKRFRAVKVSWNLLRKMLWKDLKQRQEKFKGMLLQMKRVNKEKSLYLRSSLKKILRQWCASLRSFFSPSFLGCFAGVATYVDSLFEYRHRYSVCLSKDLRSAEPPSTPPPSLSLCCRVVSALYIYLGTRRGVQNCRRMPLTLVANNFKTVWFFGFLYFSSIVIWS